MKKRLLCLALVFTMAATQAVPVAASSRKQEIQAQKSETQSKLSAAESNGTDQFHTAGTGYNYDTD